MGALGNGGFWWKFLSNGRHRSRLSRSKSSASANGGDSSIKSEGRSFKFPFQQAATAASLAVVGDTIAQARDRWKLMDRSKSTNNDIMSTLLSNYDWLRGLRMASYGFLLYGPGSYVWYQFLDRSLPKPTFENLALKVLLNQIALGPCVIAVVFAWNNLWKGKLSELPAMYQKDALPTLLYGFRFWIPVSILNFWVVPLQARVAFMSTCAIFWNFYLSSTMSKESN
ncbi:peroxisomal membrane 22 kDa (Mpv17/PMP22) family protein [Tasmannia lanceolata]|uniref:peroxisomal membrane 22 kDa (Mpv17/PMP22) family protein n=1 Tax=Tasmannia lanceolata TaxID=3420 RepID=UPI004062D5F6